MCDSLTRQPPLGWPNCFLSPSGSFVQVSHCFTAEQQHSALKPLTFQRTLVLVRANLTVEEEEEGVEEAITTSHFKAGEEEELKQHHEKSD